MTAEEVYAALLARAGRGPAERRLDAIARVLELLGRPDRRFRFIHITGTNGKTSTSRIAASVLQAHGRHVGLFTSPHLSRFTERIVVAGSPVEESLLVRAWISTQAAIEEVDAELTREGRPPVTFFEALTALAYRCFARAGVELAVVEVGVGGAWDASNAADGEVAVVAPIALDHAERLGSTVAEIAAVKAGIVKAGATVVSARQEGEAAAVLADQARRQGAGLLLAGRDFDALPAAPAVAHAALRGAAPVSQLVTLWGPFGRIADAELPLLGAHQAENAALAMTAAHLLLGPEGTNLAAARTGLREASSPGRFEVLAGSPLVVADAAHNPHGAGTLRRTAESWERASEFALVLGVLRDKDAGGIVRELAPLAGLLVATRPASERALPAEELAALAGSVRPDIPVLAAPSAESAIALARDWAGAGSGRAVLATGSIALVGEVRELLRGAPLAPPR